jgi:hypothetical protein
MDAHLEGRTGLRTALAERGIPDAMHAPIIKYVFDGAPMGSFLTALFTNDLMTAVLRADETNTRHLRAFAAAIYNDMPGDCHGSREVVSAWQSQGGLEGYKAQEIDNA